MASACEYQKVAASFVSIYYNALTSGHLDEIKPLYCPNAKVSHWGAASTVSAVATTYKSGACVQIASWECQKTEMRPDASGRATTAGITITLRGVLSRNDRSGATQDFQHDISLVGAAASSSTYGIVGDFMRRAIIAPPPPAVHGNWADETPTLTSKRIDDAALPTMDPLPSVEEPPSDPPAVDTEEVAAAEAVPEPEASAAAATTPPTPAPAPEAEPAPAAEPGKPLTFAEMVRVKANAPPAKKPTPAPAAPSATAAKKDDSASAPAKTTPAAGSDAHKRGPTTSGAAASASPASASAPATGSRPSGGGGHTKKSSIRYYDVFVKGFNEEAKEADVVATLRLTDPVEHVKIERNPDCSGTMRTFVFIQFGADYLKTNALSRDAAIAQVVERNSKARFAGTLLAVSKVNERYGRFPPAAASGGAGALPVRRPARKD